MLNGSRSPRDVESFPDPLVGAEADERVEAANPPRQFAPSDVLIAPRRPR
jgi:hypothetical protein